MPMGIEIEKTSFDSADHSSFRDRLECNLVALKHLLSRPGFGQGPGSLGAELEMYIVDAQGHPLLANEEILEAANDPLLTVELNRYNLEYNLAPYALSAQPFLNTEQDIQRTLHKLNHIAGNYGGRMATVGILPTLTKDHFGMHCMSDRRRYHALVKQLIEKRGSNFRIDINGVDPLQLEMMDVTLEGANTSFQVHYRVSPDDFADMYNAMQLVTPLVLAVSANSPSLFGHLLWHETRIPLFKQSIDVRNTDRYHWHAPARVNFGNGWLRRGVYELFNETVRCYEPLLPICAGEDPMAVVKSGGLPALHELRLQQSSVWLWNRPVYDDNDGGHLRIEMRALPAGPTAIDMVANAALQIGLAEGIRLDIDSLIAALPFYLAEHNFYRAAQDGLQATLVWPSPTQYCCEEKTLLDILLSLMPVARAGLRSIGIEEKEITRYLGVIEKRLENGQTGSVWQQRALAQLESRCSRRQALHLMLEQMLQNANINLPVAEWGPAHD